MPPSLRRAFKRPPLRQRADARIHLALGDINTGDNQTVLCHHPAPFLARFGLKAHATVRVEEDTGSVPRSPSGSQPLSTNGLRSSDGRLVRTARSHILANFSDTRARRKPLKPLRGECRAFSGVTVVTNARAYYHYTRGCGRIGRPAFPAPSDWRVRKFDSKPRAYQAASSRSCV